MLDKDMIISEARKEVAFSSALKQLGFVPGKHVFSDEVLSYYSLVKDYRDLENMPETFLRNKLLDQIKCFINSEESLVDKVARLESELEFAQNSNIGQLKSIETLREEVRQLKSCNSNILMEKEIEDLQRQLFYMTSWNSQLRKAFEKLYKSKLFRFLFCDSDSEIWYKDLIDDQNDDSL